MQVYTDTRKRREGGAAVCTQQRESAETMSQMFWQTVCFRTGRGALCCGEDLVIDGEVGLLAVRAAPKVLHITWPGLFPRNFQASIGNAVPATHALCTHIFPRMHSPVDLLHYPERRPLYATELRALAACQCTSIEQRYTKREYGA